MKTELCQQLLKLYHNIVAPTVEEMQVYAGCVNLIHPAAVPAAVPAANLPIPGPSALAGALIAAGLSALIGSVLGRKLGRFEQIKLTLFAGVFTFLMTLLLTGAIRSWA